MITANNTADHCSILSGLVFGLAMLAPSIDVLGQPVLAPPPNLPWVNIIYANANDKEIILEQVTGSTNFEDCICLKVLGNFPPIIVQARITPSVDFPVCESWWVKLNEPGESQPYEQNTTSNKMRRRTGSAPVGDLELCVRAKNVRMQSLLRFSSKEPALMATVTLTVMPGL